MILAYRLADGRVIETAYGRAQREAEARRLAARTPREIRRDKKWAREARKRQLENWRQLYRAAGLEVDF